MESSLPHLLSTTFDFAESLCAILRNCYSVPRRPPFSIRSLTRTYSPCKGRRTRNPTRPSISDQEWSPCIFNQPQEVSQSPLFHFSFFVHLPISGQGSRDIFGRLSEIGSFQLEYMYLAKLTGNKTHYDRVRKHSCFHRSLLLRSSFVYSSRLIFRPEMRWRKCPKRIHAPQAECYQSAGIWLVVAHTVVCIQMLSL